MNLLSKTKIHVHDRKNKRDTGGPRKGSLFPTPDLWLPSSCLKGNPCFIVFCSFAVQLSLALASKKAVYPSWAMGCIAWLFFHRCFLIQRQSSKPPRLPRCKPGRWVQQIWLCRNNRNCRGPGVGWWPQCGVHTAAPMQQVLPPGIPLLLMEMGILEQNQENGVHELGLHCSLFIWRLKATSQIKSWSVKHYWLFTMTPKFLFSCICWVSDSKLGWEHIAKPEDFCDAMWSM